MCVTVDVGSVPDTCPPCAVSLQGSPQASEVSWAVAGTDILGTLLFLKKCLFSCTESYLPQAGSSSLVTAHGILVFVAKARLDPGSSLPSWERSLRAKV